MGGTGWASTDGDLLAMMGATAGAWTRAGPVQVVGLFSPIRLEGEWFPELGGRIAVRAGPADLDGYLGWRAAAGDVEDDAWGGGSAQILLNRQIALVVSAGRYPSDLLQGLPGGRQLSAGIRVSRSRPDSPADRTLFSPVYAESEDGFRSARFEIDEDAERVEIAGEWTHWEPVPMRSVPGRPGVWEVVLDLPPGAYRFNVILDGERWMVPDGVMAVPDGYGGRVGLLVVP